MRRNTILAAIAGAVVGFVLSRVVKVSNEVQTVNVGKYGEVPVDKLPDDPEQAFVNTNGIVHGEFIGPGENDDADGEADTGGEMR